MFSEDRMFRNCKGCNLLRVMSIMTWEDFHRDNKRNILDRKALSTLKICLLEHSYARTSFIRVFSRGKPMSLFSSLNLTLDHLKYFDSYLKTYSARDSLKEKTYPEKTNVEF